MKINYLPNFLLKLERQLDFIAQDKPSAARNFKTELFKECKTLSDNPLRCRKSIYYNDDNIRDLIFKGYTIIYEISEVGISIFALTKYENYTTDE